MTWIGVGAHSDKLIYSGMAARAARLRDNTHLQKRLKVLEPQGSVQKYETTTENEGFIL